MASGGEALVAAVYVDGVCWLPGSVPPPDVAARITNPMAWPPRQEPDQELAVDGTAQTVPPAEDAPVWSEPRPAPDETRVPVEPPRAGRGSSLTAWAAYAGAVGVPVPSGATRDEVIAAIDDHRMAER